MVFSSEKRRKIKTNKKIIKYIDYLPWEKKREKERGAPVIFPIRSRLIKRKNSANGTILFTPKQ